MSARARVRRLGMLGAALLALAAPAAARAADPVVFAAGDIACDPGDSAFNGGNGTATACRQRHTADLMVAGAFDAVIALGDLQYDSASLSNFERSYALSWGRVKARTFPVIGNHEGTSATSGTGYCAYFGAAAHCNASGRQGGAAFYSFDIGDWHVVVLNSNCTAAGGCGAGSPQYQWLAADLQAHPRPCTLAAWHHPRWSSGHDGSNAFMQPLWALFHAGGGDLVLSGHSHDYERFAPMGPTGAVDPADGIRSFVVGTGGVGFTGLGGAPEPGSEARQNTTFGLLRLVLRPTSYDWAFVPEAGRTYADSGARSCRGFRADTQPPSAPGGVKAVATGPTAVDVSWSASTDDVGVSGYEVWRGTGSAAPARVGTTGATSYADRAVAAGQSYRYELRATDAAGNVSAASAAVSVTTPALAGAPPQGGGAAPPVALVPPTPAASSPSRVLARWRLSARLARRSLARGWVYVPRRRWAPTVIRVRVGGRLAAERRVASRRALRVRLPSWARQRSRRGRPVTVVIRRP